MQKLMKQFRGWAWAAAGAAWPPWSGTGGVPGLFGTRKQSGDSMSVTIPAPAHGRKHQPYYRVVVADSRILQTAHTWRCRHYNSTTKPAELHLDPARLDDWVARGATMSETVKSLVGKARKGGDASVSFQVVAAEPTPALEAPAIAPAPAAPVEAQPAD
jgi:small subunit ribosomal protein S16